jgi:hypothetical protein
MSIDSRSHSIPAPDGRYVKHHISLLTELKPFLN